MSEAQILILAKREISHEMQAHSNKEKGKRKRFVNCMSDQLYESF